MECLIRIGRPMLGTSIGLILLLIAACSMQKPASGLESRKAEEKKLTAEAALRQSAQQKDPVRIDYLTPVSEIVTPEVYIYKEKRRLYVIQSNVLVRDYPVGLGSHPSGDKEYDTDGKTPEGDFLICRKDPVARFGKALSLNYPLRRHAERAFFAGLLSPTEFKEILVAYERKADPPSHTKLGGQLMIHAGGAQRDWTEGGIALYKSDMEELFNIALTGTQIHIRP